MYSFIETRLFTRLVQDYLGDDEYRRLQIALLENPEAGDIIPGFGWHPQGSLACTGTRKARRLSRNLLRQNTQGMILDADDVSQKCN